MPALCPCPSRMSAVDSKSSTRGWGSRSPCRSVRAALPYCARPPSAALTRVEPAASSNRRSCSRAAVGWPHRRQLRSPRPRREQVRGIARPSAPFCPGRRRLTCRPPWVGWGRWQVQQHQGRQRGLPRDTDGACRDVRRRRRRAALPRQAGPTHAQGQPGPVPTRGSVSGLRPLPNRGSTGLG